MMLSTERDLEGDSHSLRSGHRAIDAIRYRQPTLLETFADRDSGILLYRTVSYGKAGTMTSAERASGEPDLLYISRGSGVAARGQVGGSWFDLKPNFAERATYVPADADTFMEFGVSARSSSLIFPKGYLNGLIAEARPGSLAPVLYTADQRLMQLIRVLEAEITAPGFAAPLLVESAARMIALLLARVDLQREAADSDRISLTSARLKRVLEHVEAHLGDDISLSELAAVACMSPFHFSRVFRRQTGNTPYQHVIQRRIARAMQLLAEQSMPLGDVARACGFSSQSHFTAAFTRAVGVAPGRFRGRLH